MAIDLTPSYGKRIPVVYGTRRVEATLVYFANRRAAAVNNSAVVINNQVQTSEVAACQLLLCEGPITAINRVWWDQYVITGANPVGQIPCEDGTSASWETSLGPAAGQVFTPLNSLTVERRVGLGSAAWIGHPGMALLDLKMVKVSCEIQASATVDANPADVMIDMLTNAVHGLGLPSTMVDVDHGPDGATASSYRAYCAAMGWGVSAIISDETEVLSLIENLLNSTNARAVWSDGKLKVYPNGDTAMTGYTPVSTAVAVGVDDFMRDGSGDIITVDRSPESTVYPECPVEFADRVAEYNKTTVSAKLDGSATQRKAGTFTSQFITASDHAMQISRLMAQRSAYIRNVYRFTLGPRHMALEPGDLVSLTEANFGLAGAVARLIKIEESDGNHQCWAEEYPAGATHVISLTTQASEGVATTQGPINLITTINAQTTANTAVTNAATAQATANAKATITQSASPPSTGMIAGDTWFNSDTTTNCPDVNCKGHTTSGGVPQVGSYPHRVTLWPHLYSGTAWLDGQGTQKILAGEIVAGVVQSLLSSSDVVQTSDFTSTGSGASEVATRGVKIRSTATDSNTVPPLLVGPNGMKIGGYLIDEIKAAALSTVGRTSDFAAAWYRGNSMFSPPGGAAGAVPVLIDPAWLRSTVYAVGDRVSAGAISYPVTLRRDGDADAATQVYVCATAGTSAATGNGPTGTANGVTDGSCVWNYVGTIASQERVTIYASQSFAYGGMVTLHFYAQIQVRSQRDNFDALRYMTITPFTGTAAVAPLTPSRSAAIPDRLYFTPGTPGDTANMVEVNLDLFGLDLIYYNGNNFPFNGYLRIKVYNVNGPARVRDYNFTAATAAPYAGLAGEFTLGGSSGGAGGGGGGNDGGCTDPNTLILVGPDRAIRIGDLQAGDYVWTAPEWGGPECLHAVAWVKHVMNKRLRLTMEDGRELICSVNHRLCISGEWVRADSLKVGQVIHGARPGIIRRVKQIGRGPVVQCSIPTALTYRSADGLWMHNVLKP